MDNDNIVNLKAVASTKEQPTGPKAHTFAITLQEGAAVETYTGFLHFSEQFITVSEDENGFLIPAVVFKTSDVTNVKRTDLRLEGDGGLAG